MEGPMNIGDIVGPGAATREHFRDDVTVVETDASAYRIYRLALNGYPVDHRIAEVVTSLVSEGVVPREQLLSLHGFLSEEQMVLVQEKFGGDS